MTKQYLDNVVLEIKSLLRLKEGRILFSALSDKFDLPNQLIKDILTSNLGDDETIDIDGISTNDYQWREVCWVWGILRGVTWPVAFVTLSNKYRINETILKKYIDQLAEAKEIHFKVSGGIYIPDCYAKI